MKGLLQGGKTRKIDIKQKTNRESKVHSTQILQSQLKTQWCNFKWQTYSIRITIFLLSPSFRVPKFVILVTSISPLFLSKRAPQTSSAVSVAGETSREKAPEDAVRSAGRGVRRPCPTGRHQPQWAGHGAKPQRGDVEGHPEDLWAGQQVTLTKKPQAC